MVWSLDHYVLGYRARHLCRYCLNSSTVQPLLGNRTPGKLVSHRLCSARFAKHPLGPGKEAASLAPGQHMRVAVRCLSP